MNGDQYIGGTWYDYDDWNDLELLMDDPRDPDFADQVLKFETSLKMSHQQTQTNRSYELLSNDYVKTDTQRGHFGIILAFYKGTKYFRSPYSLPFQNNKGEASLVWSFY